MAKCRHSWQPYADENRIWQVCVKCGVEEHVTTHERQRLLTLHYVLTGEDHPSVLDAITEPE